MTSETFLVDYDLPADSRRHGFYRRVSEYREKFGLDKEAKSTNSVIFTTDRNYAWFVYNSALALGGGALVLGAALLLQPRTPIIISK